MSKTFASNDFLCLQGDKHLQKFKDFSPIKVNS